jgi:hypothetical protein
MPWTRYWDRHPAVPTGKEPTVGERAADGMRNGMGSWPFIFGALAFLSRPPEALPVTPVSEGCPTLSSLGLLCGQHLRQGESHWRSRYRRAERWHAPMRSTPLRR